MKLVIVNAHISESLGGSEMQCDLISSGLTDRGHEVVYAAVGKNTSKQYPEGKYLIEPMDISDKASVLTFLKKHKPDIIYWRFNKKSLHNLIPAKRALNIPLVFAVSSRRDVIRFSYTPSKSLNPLRAVLNYAKQMVKSARSYHFIKEASAVTVLNSQYLNKLPVKKQATVWNAAALDKEEFSWPKPYVLWVANLKTIKRPEVYIKLARSFEKTNPNLDFIMIGAIQQPLAYEKMVEEAGKTSNFHYLGKRSPAFVNGVLEKAICMVHTCEPEGFGNNFIQAWLHACPTITLDHDPDGLIASEGLGNVSGTFEQMSTDLTQLIGNDDRRTAISQKAYEFSHKHFTPEKLTSRIENFLTETLEELRL
ncbi:MAG: glycosyltransferase [Roseivirga sp.]|nr:glycosyltransferase [Roseivirga sp.]